MKYVCRHYALVWEGTHLPSPAVREVPALLFSLFCFRVFFSSLSSANICRRLLFFRSLPRRDCSSPRIQVILSSPVHVHTDSISFEAFLVDQILDQPQINLFFGIVPFFSFSVREAFRRPTTKKRGPPFLVFFDERTVAQPRHRTFLVDVENSFYKGLGQYFDYLWFPILLQTLFPPS